MIDSHFHLWQPARGDYFWMTPEMPICRDFGLPDYRAVIPPGITGTIIVQAADTAAETDYMLRLAHASEGLIQGVVGWIDLTVETPVIPRDPLLTGIRPMLQDIADTNWILRPDVLRGLAAIRDAGLRFDALARVRHLPLMLPLARAVPGLPTVIDHAAKPEISAGHFDAWAADMAEIARETDWCCKFSGLVTEASADWTLAQLRPYTDHLLRSFGPERLMFGSDWPVVTNAATYAAWFEAAWALVPTDDRAEVFGGTARRFYGVK